MDRPTIRGGGASGRAIHSKTSFKYSIKRVDRFLGNDNVVVLDWCKALFAAVVGPRKSIRIAIDWTKIGPWPVLVASIVIRRRGIRRLGELSFAPTGWKGRSLVRWLQDSWFARFDRLDFNQIHGEVPNAL
ncbi:MAG TPA: hypothetical protein PLY68_07590 [Myxococcota bacterium]|nr:hypothetical protein [Myxococcota bacterium]